MIDTGATEGSAADFKVVQAPKPPKSYTEKYLDLQKTLNPDGKPDPFSGVLLYPDTRINDENAKPVTEPTVTLPIAVESYILSVGNELYVVSPVADQETAVITRLEEAVQLQRNGTDTGSDVTKLREVQTIGLHVGSDPYTEGYDPNYGALSELQVKLDRIKDVQVIHVTGNKDGKPIRAIALTPPDEAGPDATMDIGQRTFKTETVLQAAANVAKAPVDQTPFKPQTVGQKITLSPTAFTPTHPR
jgi:hypothetical protein